MMIACLLACFLPDSLWKNRHSLLEMYFDQTILSDVIFQPNCVLDSTFQNEGPDPVPVSSENEPGSAGKSIPGDLWGSWVWLKQPEGLSESPSTDCLNWIQCVAPDESRVVVARHQLYHLKAIRPIQSSTPKNISEYFKGNFYISLHSFKS